MARADVDEIKQIVEELRQTMGMGIDRVPLIQAAATLVVARRISDTLERVHFSHVIAEGEI